LPKLDALYVFLWPAWRRRSWTAPQTADEFRPSSA
jgi:hypothetical protein